MKVRLKVGTKIYDTDGIQVKAVFVPSNEFGKGMVRGYSVTITDDHVILSEKQFFQFLLTNVFKVGIFKPTLTILEVIECLEGFGVQLTLTDKGKVQE